MVCECIAFGVALIAVTITAYLWVSTRTGPKYDTIHMIGLILKELSQNLFNNRQKYIGDSDIKGKVVVITGANSGIGKVNALDFAKRGANVIIGCRDMEKSNNAIEHIRKEYRNANIRAIKLDLSSLKSVRQFAKQLSEEVKQIDILINNAGVMGCPKWETEDGFEMQFGTNHLGHFLLTLLLLDQLKAAPKARIVTVSGNIYLAGGMHFDDINLDKDYSPLKGYMRSKLANVLFSRELARRLSSTNITTYCLHPGIIRTELSRHVSGFESLFGRIYKKLFLISPELGAQTTLYCALDKSISNESGHYYDNCRKVNRIPSNVTDESAMKLWDLSCDLVKLEDRFRFN